MFAPLQRDSVGTSLYREGGLELMGAVLPDPELGKYIKAIVERLGES